MYLQKCTPEQLKDIYAEFGVTENTLKQDAATVMDWLEKEPHLPNVQDEEFIINILLKCKVSVENTKRMLNIYFTSNHMLGKLFSERDIDTKLNILHDTLQNRGFYVPMPKLTPEGYRVLILAFRDNGPIPSTEDMVQMLDITLKTLLKLDRNKSVILIYDFKSLTVNSMTAIAAAVPKISDITYKKMRMRYVKFYLVNLLPQYEFLINFCKALMNAKEIKKIEIWKKEKENLIEVLPKDVLPVEFGGTEKPLMECAELWYQEIESLKPWLSLESTWMADPKKRPAENQNSDHTSANYGLDGTFKKLAVD